MDLAIITGSIGLVLGIALRTVWEAYVRRAAELDGKRLELLERQLVEFYWPLYLRLQKDNAVWEKILDRSAPDDIRRRVGHEIERTVILPNHDEIISIIEQKIHLADPDEELTSQLLKYMRHVAVYKGLRSSGIHDRDPLALGEPWPTELFPLVRTRTLNLQNRYNSALETFVARLGAKGPRRLTSG